MRIYESRLYWGSGIGVLDRCLGQYLYGLGASDGSPVERGYPLSLFSIGEAASLRSIHWHRLA